MKWKLLLFSLIAAIGLGVGCASIQPGNDPLVVRTEQTLATGKSLFDTTLGIDHANRPFFATNAPAFHIFCEWLREPQAVPELSGTLPRASALLYSLDTIKRDYQASKASSNTLYTALATFESVSSQAGAWLTIATNLPNFNQQ